MNRASLLLATVLLMTSSETACSNADSRPEPGVHATGGARAKLDAGPLFPLSTKGSELLDAAGRSVILRGLQHHSLQDVRYGGREVMPDDYPRIASWGFNSLRVAFSWSRIEPTRGSYDDAYFAEMRAVLDAAQAAGLGVILEWHQDMWGKCSQPADSPTTPNANGAPDWTCPADYEKSFLKFGVLFDRLYANEDGLLDAYLAAWTEVVKRFGSHPAVVGYDIFNEPHGSAESPALERDGVFPMYRKTIAALRSAGAKQLIFLDAPIGRYDTFVMYTEPFASVDPGLVYAPHLYTNWIGLYYLKRGPTQESKERDFSTATEQGAALGLPVWNGEWGVNYNLESVLEDLERHVLLEDRYRMGSSYWAFQRAVPGQGDDSISGGQAILNTDRTIRYDLLDKLARPYAVQTPGTLATLKYDFATRRLLVEADIKDTTVPMVLFAPRRHLTDAVCLSVDGGGFQWDEATNERLLVLFASAGRHTVHLAPCE
jgi:hypothetical protein